MKLTPQKLNTFQTSIAYIKQTFACFVNPITPHHYQIILNSDLKHVAKIDIRYAVAHDKTHIEAGVMVLPYFSRPEIADMHKIPLQDTDITADVYAGLKVFTRNLFPTADVNLGIVNSSLGGSAVPYFKLGFTLPMFDRNALLGLNNLMALCCIPEQLEQTHVFCLQDQQTGDVYSASFDQCNEACVGITLNGFARADSPTSHKNICWLEAIDGDIRLRIYNDPNSSSPTDDIQLNTNKGQ
jgi:hypothetical protein